MKLNPDQPLAGVLIPAFAVRMESDLGVGDTEGIRRMIDWCHELKLNLLQTLPINETSDDNSPYNAISSLALEPSTIAVSPRHLPDLARAKFNELATPELLAELRRGRVNYPRVRHLKRALLEAAFKHFLQRHFQKDTPRAAAFREFLAANADWISDYALFRVLMECNGGVPTWTHWPAEHQSPQRARTWLLSQPGDRREALTRQQLFFAYVQWIAFTQWTEIKAYGTARKVFLMGDIPFGVGRYSADVWANRTLFDLEWSGGAPPEKVFKVDPFTEKWGQNWGIPNYRWEEHRRRDFDWWRTRVGNIQRVFHLYRIDHVLGFFRIYSFPWTPDRNHEFLPLTEDQAAARTDGRLPGFKQFPDDTIEHQAANQAQGEEILRVVQEASGETTVVAEDLGVVPDYVPPTLLKFGMPGFRIPNLFRNHDDSYQPVSSYPRLSLAQPATHDHPPLAAAWAEAWAGINSGRDVEKNRRELRAFLDFAGLTGEEPPLEFNDHVREAFTSTVLGSPSWLSVLQIQDIFGMTDRFNTPGSVDAANWSARLPFTVREMSSSPTLKAQAQGFAAAARAAGRGL